MRSLKDILNEGILADIDAQIERGDNDIKAEIQAFLKENYIGTFKISKTPNSDGLYEVSSLTTVLVKNKNITSLTNGMFVWTIVEGLFGCANCHSLKSLEGAPKEIVDAFSCMLCDNLTSLEGAPKKVVGDFSCASCHSLKSLEHAPKEVGGDFNCSYCPSLKSLEGAPKKVRKNFICIDKKAKFTKEDVKKVSNVKGKIVC
jgi:hypothetical protein